MTGHAQGERTDTLSEGMNSALPCQLYVLNKDTGEAGWRRIFQRGRVLQSRYKAIRGIRRKWNM